MNWQSLLTDLRKRGWTQQQIAERVGASQAAISDLNSGKTTNPAYALGRALELLRESGAAPEQDRAAA
jgi:transcriptional regulator with XRE-family HTH domain